MSQITDLTGTKWEFNSELYPTWDVGEYGPTLYPHITFISNGETYNRLNFYFNPREDAVILRYGSTFVYDLYEEDGWIDQSYRTIEITGGTDATNADLIAWLQSNATQIIEPEPEENPKISIGTLPLVSASVGNAEMRSIWVGNVKVWEKVPDYDYAVSDGVITLNNAPYEVSEGVITIL